MWVERLARFGCLSKGIVYFVVGLLLLQITFGISAETTSSRGALKFISAQPFGNIALIIIALGLICYTLWRLFEALSPYCFQFSRDKIFKRISYLSSGVSYGSLAFSAIKIILNLRVEYENKAADLTAQLMYQPFGQVLVGTVGLVIVGVGAFYFYRAFKQKLCYESNLKDKQPPRYILVITTISKFGMTARGFVFILIGFFVIQSARQFEPETAAGFDRTIEIIAMQPQGKLLLTIIGFGFMAYSVHMCIEAKYRDFSRLREKTRKTIENNSLSS